MIATTIISSISVKPRSASRGAVFCTDVLRWCGNQSGAPRRARVCRPAAARRLRLGHSLLAAPLFGRLGPRGEVEGGVHQADVRERLREVSDQALALEVVLLREQPDVVGAGDQALEQLARVVSA